MWHFGRVTEVRSVVSRGPGERSDCSATQESVFGDDRNSLSWWWWQLQNYIHLSRRIRMNTLRGWTFLYVNYTSMNLHLRNSTVPHHSGITPTFQKPGKHSSKVYTAAYPSSSRGALPLLRTGWLPIQPRRDLLGDTFPIPLSHRNHHLLHTRMDWELLSQCYEAQGPITVFTSDSSTRLLSLRQWLFKRVRERERERDAGERRKW